MSLDLTKPAAGTKPVSAEIRANFSGRFIAANS